MASCSFEKLVQYLDKQLNLDEQLEVLEHLDFCETCREAIYQIILMLIDSFLKSSVIPIYSVPFRLPAIMQT